MNQLCVLGRLIKLATKYDVHPQVDPILNKSFSGGSPVGDYLKRVLMGSTLGLGGGTALGAMHDNPVRGATLGAIYGGIGGFGSQLGADASPQTSPMADIGGGVGAVGTAGLLHNVLKEISGKRKSQFLGEDEDEDK